MARIKGCARKTPGGTAPRVQLASTAARKSAPSAGRLANSDDDSSSDEYGSRKRKHDDLSSPGDDDPEAFWRAKRHAQAEALLTPGTSPLRGCDHEGEIKGLQTQIKELQDFIEASGLSLKAPPSIRQQLESRPEGPVKLAKAIKRDIYATYVKLTEDSDDEEEITSDDISQAMVPYIAEIERLSNLPGPQSVDLAIQCLWYLGQHSSGDMESAHDSGYGDRDSDEPADDLMLTLITRQRALRPKWKGKILLQALKREHDALDAYGIETYFPRTIAELSMWKTEKIGDAADANMSPAVQLAPLSSERVSLSSEKPSLPSFFNNNGSWNLPASSGARLDCIVDLTGED